MFLPTVMDFLQQYTQCLSFRHVLVLRMCVYVGILVQIRSALFKAISQLLYLCCFGLHQQASAVQYMRWIPFC